MSNTKWTRDLILKTLRTLHRRGADLSYNALAARQQPLVSAANYHFKSYKRAVEAAGIDYAEVRRKPKWSADKIAALLRKARRKGEDLSWRAVTLRHDELSRAASAAVHPHLFGTWNDALAAAGLDPQKVARYRRWDGPAVKKELQDRRRTKRPVNAGVIQKEVPGLYRGAVRAFGSYDAALKAAGVNPDDARQRRTWNRPAVLDALREFHAEHGTLSHGVLRERDAGLLRAATLLPGGLPGARTAALKSLPGRAKGRRSSAQQARTNRRPAADSADGSPLDRVPARTRRKTDSRQMSLSFQ